MAFPAPKPVSRPALLLNIALLSSFFFLAHSSLKAQDSKLTEKKDTAAIKADKPASYPCTLSLSGAHVDDQRANKQYASSQMGFKAKLRDDLTLDASAALTYYDGSDTTFTTRNVVKALWSLTFKANDALSLTFGTGAISKNMNPLLLSGFKFSADDLTAEMKANGEFTSESNVNMDLSAGLSRLFKIYFGSGSLRTDSLMLTPSVGYAKNSTLMEYLITHDDFSAVSAGLGLKYGNLALSGIWSHPTKYGIEGKEAGLTYETKRYSLGASYKISPLRKQSYGI